MCLNPNLVRSRLDSSTGAIQTIFLGKAGIVDPHNFGEPFVDHEWYSTVPCGQCRECKMDYARQWANRMILEARDWPRNLFLLQRIIKRIYLIILLAVFLRLTNVTYNCL